MVAPAMASISSRAMGRVLPMNCFWNSSSRAFAPRPAVSAKLSSPILMAVMVLLSTVTSTATGPAKPLAEPVWVSPVAAAGSLAGASVAVGSSTRASVTQAALIASTTAVEVMVAPAMASISSRVSGGTLPMNCALKASSRAFAPRPAVSAKLSSPMVIAAIAPFPSRSTATATGPAKPCLDAVRAFSLAAGTGSASSAAGAETGAAPDS